MTELEALDKAATQGVWREAGGDALLVGRDNDLRVVGSLTGSEGDPAFIVALVNAYRTGQLVPREAVEGAVEALEPFADFAANFVDNDGWNDVGLSVHKERISYWFGPSQFRAAATTLASLKGTDDADG